MGSATIDGNRKVAYTFLSIEVNIPRNEPPLSNEQEKHPDDHHLDNDVDNNILGVSKEKRENTKFLDAL